MERTISRPDDIAYAQQQFRVIERTDPTLPEPAYVDTAGNIYVPHDYEEQERDRERFIVRMRAEIERLGMPLDESWIAEQWDAYRGGGYSLCLRVASPENIVRKGWIMQRIDTLVDELDALERPFSAFDREYFGGRVSRDRYITAFREGR
jgi:hypothetical protein